MNKEEYKKEIVRMWDSLRVNDVGNKKCMGVICEECPLYDIDCESSTNAFEMIEIVEKWSNEHQPKKYKVSKLEYDILEINLKYIRKYHWKFNQARKLCDLLEKGYFEGATSETYINDYFDNCEVEDDNEKK